MLEYSFKIRVRDLTSGEENTTVHQSQDLRKAPGSLGNGLTVDLSTGVLRCKDVQLRDQETVVYPPEAAEEDSKVEPELEFYLEVTDVYPRAEDDSGRFKRKVCMNCTSWDREEGQRKFKAPTHNYANGSFSQVEEVMRMVASRTKGQTLTETTVGFCPIHNRICAESSRACKEHYRARPFLARFRNWWKRQFR